MMKEVRNPSMISNGKIRQAGVNSYDNAHHSVPAVYVVVSETVGIQMIGYVSDYSVIFFLMHSI